jgi:hypothetical protein
VGKWRRQLVLPHINACAANALPNPAQPAAKLRLPAKSSEGDMPLIALTSGCDPAECFLRDIGIDDGEFVPPSSPTGHVHFFTGQLGSSVNGGGTYQDTYTWWGNPQNLLKYDIVFNACECSPNDRNTGGSDAYSAMHDYLSGGGRLYTTHYYYNWFAPPTGPVDYQGVVNWTPESGTSFASYFIDSSFPKGKAFADWLEGQGVTQTYGQINLIDTKTDVSTIKPPGSTRWIYNADSAGNPNYATSYLTFNTPVGAPAAMQCGRAVFSDVHLSGASNRATFPAECMNADPGGLHVKNEQALEFLFFDLSSCVQDNSQPPPPPPTK